MDTKTILAALDGQILDAPATVRMLCKAVDQMGAQIVQLRDGLTDAIATMRAIDAFIANKPFLLESQRNELVEIIVGAMGPEATCGRAEKVDTNG